MLAAWCTLRTRRKTTPLRLTLQAACECSWTQTVGSWLKTSGWFWSSLSLQAHTFSKGPIAQSFHQAKLIVYRRGYEVEDRLADQAAKLKPPCGTDAFPPNWKPPAGGMAPPPPNALFASFAASQSGSSCKGKYVSKSRAALR